MKYLAKAWHGFLAVLKTLRLALPKIGVGWMFALLTIDFNRIAIVELGITAILITGLLSVHYFLSPFQVIFGRYADRHPIFGLRRTPYLMLSGVVTSAIFVMLPRLVHQMAGGSVLAYLTAFLAFVLFGVAIAMMGDSHHALIVETTESKWRGAVISVVQIVTIMSTIMAAVVMNIVRPIYTPEAMQTLYNLTPMIVIGTILLGTIGLERRLKGQALTDAMRKAQEASPDGSALSAAYHTLQRNRQARNFFFFIFIAIFAIFLQDNILEVFGAEVFGMSVEQTTRFQPTWGGGVLLGMLAMGLLSMVLPVTKKTITLIGVVGTAVGMATLAVAALVGEVSLVHPALFGMGVFTGFFNVGALSMMMDMTVEGATGLFMGMWGIAQAFGNAFASLGSGALHTFLIESGLAAPSTAYFAIFGIEAVGMLVAGLIMTHISVTRFQQIQERRLTPQELSRTMEAGLAA